MTHSTTNELVDNDEDATWHGIDGLVDFKRTYGHHDLSNFYQHHGTSFFAWLDDQRRHLTCPGSDCCLDQDKMNRLIDAGIDMVHDAKAAPNDSALTRTKQQSHGDPEEELLDHMLKSLGVFKEILGHLSVSAGCEYCGESLFDCVGQQRERFRDASKRNEWQDKIDRQQNLGLDLLPGERYLGVWLEYQQRRASLTEVRRSSLLEHQFSRLVDLGVRLGERNGRLDPGNDDGGQNRKQSTNDDRWETMFNGPVAFNAAKVL